MDDPPHFPITPALEARLAAVTQWLVLTAHLTPTQAERLAFEIIWQEWQRGEQALADDGQTLGDDG